MRRATISRRDLLAAAGSPALLAQTMAGKPVGKPAPLGSDRKIRVAIAGGNFGTTFFFHEHPNCSVAAVADLRAGRRKRLAQVYRCDNMYESLETMLEKEKRLDAVALFTHAPDHFKHVSLGMKRVLPQPARGAPKKPNFPSGFFPRDRSPALPAAPSAPPV